MGGVMLVAIVILLSIALVVGVVLSAFLIYRKGLNDGFVEGYAMAVSRSWRQSTEGDVDES